MARREKNQNKEPGKIKQMWQVFLMTRRYDPASQWWIITALVLPIIVGIVVAFVFNAGSIFGIILWILFGVLAGILAAMIVLGRKAEKAAYSQIAGQPGAVGAVIKSSLRRGWRGSEMPVAVNPKSQDAVYRVVGKGGIVLVGEGPKTRTQKMLNEEKRKVARIVPNVEISFLHVGPDDDAVELHRLAAAIAKTPRVISKAEVTAVSNRLNSIGSGFAIPKGIDPARVRPDRKAVRGR